MNPAALFAQHFAHLVWLLMREPASVEEQKTALRAALAVNKESAVNLALMGQTLSANGAPLSDALQGMGELGSRMLAHGLAMIAVDAGASPAHVLSVGRILASMPVLDDGGANAEAQRLASGATTVHFAARPRPTMEMSRILTPASGTPIVEPPPPPPAATRSSEGMSAMEFGDVLDDPLGEALARATPRSTQSIQLPEKRGDGGGLFAQFAATRAPTESPEELLRKLEASHDPHAHANILDDLAVHAENAAKEHKPIIVCEILSRVVKREAQLEDPESRRIFNLSLRKMTKPAVMQAVTSQLAIDPDRRADYMAILIRAGENGADALIEQIGAVAHQRDRRVYYDALLQLKAGVPSLLHLLGDSRWYAVRNAAEILGEMHVKEAEKPLTDLLKHEDERVRRAATGGLMRLGTAKAMQAIQSGLADPSPEMRSEAGAALVSRHDPRSSQMLLAALDVEKDEQVQCAFLLSLGRMGTPEAVQRLIRSAEAERGLFKKKSTAFRVAAVHGLSEARTMEATDALRALQTDRDLEVRDAARFALSRIARGMQTPTR